jgi:tryptophan synthase alpha chain
MNRIDRIFSELRGQGGKALMPFVTAGDPDLQTTAALLPAFEAAGASICEVGIPFSDPIADGPVIQASMTHALSQGVRTAEVFDTIRRVRPTVNLGLVAMLSYSIVRRIGDAAFARQAAAAGFDGLIIPDLPIDEAEATRELVGEAGLTCSFLIAPTTPPDRARRIAQACSGFVYLLARAGITGERADLPADLPRHIQQLRDVTDLPIAVGFGISTPQHVQQVIEHADAAIVGSAIVRRIALQRDAGREAVVADAADFVRELAGGLVKTTPA